MGRKLVNKREAGFTIPEVLVTLIIAVAILAMTATLLFDTQKAADRQRAQVEARQAARAAAEYVHYMLRGATDMNGQIANAPSPMALLTYARFGNNNADSQVSYDNLTAAQAAAGFGDEGTDILTFARAEDSRMAPILRWVGQTNAANAYFRFNELCPNSAANFARFKQVTGAHMEGTHEVSEPFVVFDSGGQMRFYQITDYKDSTNSNNCSSGQGGVPAPVIWVVANPGISDFVNPPGGLAPNLDCSQAATTCWGALGVRFFTLRVRNGWLEQKAGVFDPANPGKGFVPILPNVEDLQVSYFFRSGAVRNNDLAGGTPGWVPPMSTNPAPWDSSFNPLDLAATNVLALRLTLTTRSATPLPPREQGAGTQFFRPPAENHLGSTTRDNFYHYQVSVMTLIRSRTPQA
ncbi:MAG: type IV pilus modification PilV family protein [Thermoanaerobaculaceae bacterium]